MLALMALEEKREIQIIVESFLDYIENFVCIYFTFFYDHILGCFLILLSYV